MSRKFLIATFLLLALFASALFVRADDAELEVNDASASAEEVHEYDETTEETQEPVMYITAAPDVATTIYFPTNNQVKPEFPAGEEVVALLGLTNTGDRTYNLSYIGAHLHSAYDFSFFIQNFTVRAVNQLLPPQSEVTVEYRFTPDERLEPADFHLSGWIFYNATEPATDIFRSTWVNATVEVYEKPAQLTVGSFFSYVVIFSIIGGIAYFFLQKKVTPSKKSSSSSSNGSWDVKVYTPKPATSSKNKKAASNKSQ